MLYWKNYVDKKTGVRGIAMVLKNYDAQIHLLRPLFFKKFMK